MLKEFTFCFFILLFGNCFAQQWQVIPPTDSIQIRDIHIHNNYLFVSYSSLYGGNFNGGFHRIDLNNFNQSQPLFDVDGQLYPLGDVGSLGTANGQLFGANYKTVIVSGDNGNTWTENYSTTQDLLTLVADDNFMYIGKGRTLLRSTDLAVNLSTVYYESYYVNTAIRPLLIEDGIAYSTQAAGLMRIGSVINPLEFFTLTSNGTEMYGVAYQDHIYKSTNSGLDWTQMSTNVFDAEYIKKLELHNGFLYAATDEGVFISDDEGVSFQEIGLGLPFGAHDLEFYNDSIYVATLYGVFVLPVSSIIDNLGISTNKPIVQHSVYPNPSSGEFFIVNADAEDIAVYDELGRAMVIKTDVKDDNIRISLQEPKKGCYFVHIDTKANGVIIKKLMIQ